MKDKLRFRTIDGHRWVILDWSWDKSEALVLRTEFRMNLIKKYPKAIFKIEPFREEGFGDVKWQVLGRLHG
jgi:hypothetical protein